MMKFLDWKSANLTALILSAILGFGGLAFQSHLQEQARIERIKQYRAERLAREAEPADKWFVVKNVAIPDFTQGEDPAIIYDREYRGDASINRDVDIHLAETVGAPPICSGRNVTARKSDTLADVKILLSDFVGTPCKLAPGKYVAETSWLIIPEGYPPKHVSYVSNIFQVIPSGSLDYVPPEQVQQLENAQKLLNNQIPVK